MHRTTIARLATFALVLFGAFGTAYAAGEKLPGHSHGAAGHTHNTAPQPSSTHVAGYDLVLDSTPGSANVLMFHIKAPNGSTVSDFVEKHGSKLHTVLVRPDLSGFDHIHPTIADDGTWKVTMPPGQWHIVFDTLPAGAKVSIALAFNYDDETKVAPVALPAADDSPTVGGITVTRTTSGGGLSFTATQDGAPATGLEPYLGQPAHLIAIRQGDLAYTHLHPNAVSGAPVETMPGMDMGNAAPGTPGNVFTFAGNVTQPGTYRMFLQFGHAGKVVTFAYTVVVE